MAQLFTNNAHSLIEGGGISDTDTSLTITADTGDRFPSPTGSDYFLLTLIGIDGDGLEDTWEIVKCTTRAGDVITIERAQEDTVALAWGAALRVELRVTAGSVNAMIAATKKAKTLALAGL